MPGLQEMEHTHRVLYRLIIDNLVVDLAEENAVLVGIKSLLEVLGVMSRAPWGCSDYVALVTDDRFTVRGRRCRDKLLLAICAAICPSAPTEAFCLDRST